MLRALILFALAGAAIAADYAEMPAATRPLLALPFLLAGPGLAWLNRSRDLTIPVSAAIVVGLSLAVETVIGTILLLCGFWSPQVGLGMLLAITVAGLLCSGNRKTIGPASSAEQTAEPLTTT